VTTAPEDATNGDKKILVGITFGDPFRAQEFLTETTRLASLHKLEVLDAVIVTKNDDGHTHVRETIDPTPGRTAFTGAVWAGLFGLLLGGPVGWLAGAAVGAGAGAATAKVVDLGIPDAWVEWFREAVRPDSTTVALLVTKLDRDALVTEAGRFTGAQLIYADLDDGTIERISEAFGSAPPRPTGGATRRCRTSPHPGPSRRPRRPRRRGSPPGGTPARRASCRASWSGRSGRGRAGRRPRPGPRPRRPPCRRRH
jgi:uncharacterized membrane protein